MLYLWNGFGDTLEFTPSAFIRRARYHGEAGTPGVEMYLIDGVVWFYKPEHTVTA